MNNMLPSDSDLLERYALGLTSTDENMRVESLRKESPKIDSEIKELQNSLEHLASSYERTPRPELQAAIWSAIRTASVPTQSTGITEPASSMTPSITTSQTATHIPSSVIILGLLTVCGVIFGAYYFSKYADLQTSMEQSRTQITDLQTQINQTKSDLQKSQRELAFRNSASTLVIPIIDRNEPDKVMARVYVNPSDTLRYVLFSALNSNEDKHTYNLWAFAGGTFNVVHSIRPTEVGIMTAILNEPTSHDFIITRDTAAPKRSPDPSNIVAFSAKKLLLLSQPPRAKRDAFIAGEPIRPKKRP